jgi:hypothetical protein
VLIDPVSTEAFGFIPFMDAYETVQKTVGHNLDYGTRVGLPPLLRQQIEREGQSVLSASGFPTFVKKWRGLEI